MLSLQDFLITSEFVTFKYYKILKQQDNKILVSIVCGRDIVVCIIQKYGTNKFGEFIWKGERCSFRKRRSDMGVTFALQQVRGRNN